MMYVCDLSVQEPKETVEEVAHLLTEIFWTLCTGFELGDYLFLNDATSEDGPQEYAVVKKPSAPDGPFLQIESIALSRCGFEKASDLIGRIVAGEFDRSNSVAVVVPRLESADEHQTRDCPQCA